MGSPISAAHSKYNARMSRLLSQLLAALPHPFAAPAEDPVITGITDDNRTVQPGNLFVAYKGVAVDAHRFIPDAIARGAAAVVAEAGCEGASVPAVQVPNGREALAHLSAAWRDHPSRAMTVIGITGTDGKTTTSNLLFSILRAAGHKAGMISTVNAMIGDQTLETGLHTTTPKADDIQRYLAQMRDAATAYCVLEVTSHGLAQHRVDGVDFDLAIVTNITHEHLDLHGTREAYRAAKARLFEMARVHVLNVDDEYSFSHLARLDSQRQLRYSREVQPSGAYADWWLFAPRSDAAGTIDAHGFRPGQRLPLPLTTQLTGAFNVSNVLAASTAALAMAIPIDAIQRGVAAVGGVSGRMQRIDAGQPYLAVVDFAHTPNSLQNCLTALRAITPSRLIVAFGCAGQRDVQKRPMMGAAADALADVVILTAEDPRNESFDAICDEIVGGMTDKHAEVHRVMQRGEALRLACSLARPGDTVVACGKGHEQSLCFGATEYAWDDRAAMRAAIQGRALPLGPALT